MTRRMSADERNDLKVARATLAWWASARTAVTAAGIMAVAAGHAADQAWDEFHPSRRFGRPTLIALTSRAGDLGCCRWGRLFRAAADEHTDMPPLTPARRELLGQPCEACLAAMAAALDSGVHASLSPQMRARVARRVVRASLVASVRAAQPFLHDAIREPCPTCHDWRTRARVAYSAGAEIEPLRPHRARPASTGFAGVPGSVGLAALAASASRRASTPPIRFVHDLEGGKMCNCDTCRAKRSRLAKARPR
jgi:hypothetical protein